MKRLSALLTLAAICIAAQAQAATFTLNPVVVGAVNAAFEPIVPKPSNISADGKFVITGAGPAVYQVDFMLTTTGLTGTEDSFGLVGFNVLLEAGLTDEQDVGWVANNPTVDSNGNAPGGTVTLFSQNGDFGTSATDEQGILVQMATGAFANAVDPRRTVGEVGSPLGVPYKIGTMYVKWDQQHFNVNLSVAGAQFAVKNVDGTFTGDQAGTTGTVVFGDPEPTTLALAGVSLIGLAFLRRKG